MKYILNNNDKFEIVGKQYLEGVGGYDGTDTNNAKDVASVLKGLLNATCPNDEIWYTSNDGNIVTPYATNVFGANVVSNTYENGKGIIKFDGDVTSIGERAFSDCSSLKSITIPDSVTSIGGGAFIGCSSLTSITIPDSVTSIGIQAFEGCSSLTSITIPDGVTSIGEGAFIGCTSLTSVTIGNGVTEIGDRAFAGCTSLTNITIPDSVTSIGDYALNSCTSLTSVTIPDSVTSIGKGAFYYCTSLKSVTIGDGVTSIGNEAFYNCTGELIINSKIVETNYSANYPQKDGWLIGAKFTKLTIGDSVTSIGTSAFWGCSSLTSVTIGNGVTSIGSGAFSACTSLTSVTIGNGVTSIGNGAFATCTSLTSITIPDSVITIRRSAFNGCTSLRSITIPDSVALIGQEAFWDCTSLRSITIPDSVLVIENKAFYGCTSLTSVTIHDSVTSIGSVAFNMCSKLTSIYCKPTTPPTLVSTAFNTNASGRKIYVPIESVDAYKTASGWSDYADDIVGCVFEDEALVSGENIKTINGESILGSGNITISGSGSGSSDNIYIFNPEGVASEEYAGLQDAVNNGKQVVIWAEDGGISPVVCTVLYGYYSENAYFVMFSYTIAGNNEGIMFYNSVNVSETSIDIVGNIASPVITGVDDALNINSTNPVQNKVVLEALGTVSEQANSKQAQLVSGTNIKTINGQSILGSGDITISGSGSGDIDIYTLTSFTKSQLDNFTSGTSISISSADFNVISSNTKIICINNGGNGGRCVLVGWSVETSTVAQLTFLCNNVVYICKVNINTSNATGTIGEVSKHLIGFGGENSNGGYIAENEIYQNYASNITVAPNTSVVFQNSGGGSRINLTEPTDFTKMNKYSVTIRNYNTRSQITFNKNIIWDNNDTPTLDGLDEELYELNIRCLNLSDGIRYLGAWTKFTL